MKDNNINQMKASKTTYNPLVNNLDQSYQMPSGMSSSGMSPSSMMPSGMSPSGMSPSGMSPGGMSPSGMSPGGMGVPCVNLNPSSPLSPSIPSYPTAPIYPLVQQGPPPVTEADYIPGYLASLIGRNVRAEFLLGTSQYVDRTGILVDVGVNYFVLQDVNSRTNTMCDLYSVKFVTVLF